MRVENSFIQVQGVGEKTERGLWREGVTHWDEFDESLVGAKTGRRIRSFIDAARDPLAAGDAAFFDAALPSSSQWRLFETFREDACYLDIETTGLSHSHHDVTTVSLHRGGETTTLVRGDDLTADALAAELDDAGLLVTYNGKRFDVPFLERSFDIAVDLPHLDLMYPCRRLDLTGGLKTVERAVGIERDRPDISGEDAVRLWRQYEAGDDDALETLISYNREDTANLETVADAVSSRLHDEVFAPVVADGGSE